MVELVSDYVVCKKGDTLTPQQAAILRAFHQKQSVFRMRPVARWTAEGGELEILDQEYLDSFDQADAQAFGLEGLQGGKLEFREVEDEED